MSGETTDLPIMSDISSVLIRKKNRNGELLCNSDLERVEANG